MRTSIAPGWQPKLALWLFVLALVSPLSAPFIVTADLAPEEAGPLAGFLLFGLPMGLMMIVIGLMGQPAYAFIKRIVGQASPPARVGATRFRIGVILVLIAVLVSWFEPFVSPHVAVMAERRVLIGSLADALVLIGLAVLGGEFWDRLHALFVHDARVVPDPTTVPAAAAEVLEVGARFYVGVAVLSCMLFAWGLIPAASAAGWSTARIASLTGGIFIANKVLLVTAIAIMGKPGFNHIKRLVSGFLRRFGPAQQVSRERYRLGLALFLVPFLMTWVAPYVTGLVQPGSVYGFLQELALEVLLLVGLFMLGGEFWDKMRALFRHRAKVEFG